MKTQLKNTIKHVATTTLAAVCLATAAVGAHAGENADGAPTRTVRYGDLDVGTAQGAVALYARIHFAAVQVCGGAYPVELARATVQKACVERAVAAVVKAVNKPALTQVYEAQAVKPLTVAER